MATTNYNIRLDEALKDRAFSVIESYGLTPAQAIKLFLHQVAETNSIPLEFSYQSRSTLPLNTANELLDFEGHYGYGRNDE